MSPATATLNRIDPASNAVAAQIKVATVNPCPLFPDVCDEVAASNDAVWISLFPDNAVARVDPAAGRVVATIPVGVEPEGIAVSPGAVWVVNRGGPTLSRIDPATNTVAATIRLGPAGKCCSGHTEVATGGGAVWATLPDLHEIVRIDPATNKIAAKIVLSPLRWPQACAFIVASRDAVWAAGDHCAPSVARINAHTNKPIGRVPGFKVPLGVGLAFGSLWVADLHARSLFRVDAHSGRLIGQIIVGGQPDRLTIGFGSIWIRDDKGRVLRFAPHR